MHILKNYTDKFSKTFLGFVLGRLKVTKVRGKTHKNTQKYILQQTVHQIFELYKSNGLSSIILFCFFDIRTNPFQATD